MPPVKATLSPKHARTAQNAPAPPLRCPACFASLAHLPVTTRAAREAGVIVARDALAGRATTSRRVAEALSCSQDKAAKALQRAARDYLLRCERRAAVGGGRAYHYAPRPGLVAYLPQDNLARDLADLLTGARASGEAARAALTEWAAS